MYFDDFKIHSMSDQNTSDADRRVSHSLMDGPFNPTAGYVADSEDTFVFRAKSEESFPPKKRGWFSKEKKGRGEKE
ncbi:hypothetical protein Hanom_Chr16g01435521 [Helianthus anomalus]